MSTRDMIFRIKYPRIKKELIPYYTTAEDALIDAGFNCVFSDHFGTGFELNINDKNYLVAPDHVQFARYRICNLTDSYVPYNNSTLVETIEKLTAIKDGVILYPTDD